MIRGIGDPLLAMYARAYFVRKSWDIDICFSLTTLNTTLQAPIAQCLSDSAATLRQLSQPYWQVNTSTLLLHTLLLHNSTLLLHTVFERQRGNTASASTALLAGKY